MVIDVNLGHILLHFRNIARFLKIATPPLFQAKFEAIPIELNCRSGARKSKALD